MKEIHQYLKQDFPHYNIHLVRETVTIRCRR